MKMQAIINKKDPDDVIKNFIYGQLRPNKVLNPKLIRAFESIDRTHFLPPQHQAFAYSDANLQMGNGRFLMSPLILARLLNQVEIKETDRCLIIGDPTGYSMAILAQLSDVVFSLEEDTALSETKRNNFKDYTSYLPGIIQAPLTKGYADHAPFNLILIEGGVETVPQALFDQLSEDGALVAIHNQNTLMGRGCVWHKNHGKITLTSTFNAYIPTLVGFAKPTTFSL